MPRLVFVFLIFIIYFSSHADPVLIRKIKTTGLKVKGKVEGLYQIQLKKRKLKLGAEYLVVRLLSEDSFELLGQGKVEGHQNRMAFLKLDEENMFKQPLAGDYIIAITEGLNPEEKDGKVSEAELLEEEILPDEPGYIQLGYGYSLGSYNTQTDNAANFYKVVAYNYFSYDLTWYLDFAWRFGLNYHAYSDDIPTDTFERRSFQSKHNYTDFSGLFRLRKWGSSKWRSSFIISVITEEFSTNNNDEALLSTKFSSTGIGSRLAYEFNDPMWSHKSWGFALNDFYVQGRYLLSVGAEDGLVSRGTEAKSNFSYMVNIGANVLFYWDAIPFAKRWFLNLNYKLRRYDLTFSGPTVGQDINGAYEIPENGNYVESAETFSILFGLRLDDYIGKFFKPR